MTAQDWIRGLIALGLGMIIGMTWLYGLSWGSVDGALEQCAYAFWWAALDLVAVIGCGYVVVSIYSFIKKN